MFFIFSTFGFAIRLSLAITPVKTALEPPPATAPPIYRYLIVFSVISTTFFAPDIPPPTKQPLTTAKPPAIYKPVLKLAIL